MHTIPHALRRALLIGVSILAAVSMSALLRPATADDQPQTSDTSDLDAVDTELVAEMADYYHFDTSVAEDRVRKQHEAMDVLGALPQSVQAEWAGGEVDQVDGTRHWYVASADAQQTLDAALTTHPDLNVTTTVVEHPMSELEAAQTAFANSLDVNGIVQTGVGIDVPTNQGPGKVAHAV